MTRALVTTVSPDYRSAQTTMTDVGDAFLGEGELLVDVTHSSINYKDALALRGTRGVARLSPLVAGIDVVGTVTQSDDPRFSPGDRVTLNGEGLGETRHGGYTQRLRIPAEKTLHLPAGVSPSDAAAVGTAGLTAALSVLAIMDAGIDPSQGRVLVTGATGGVGMMALSLLKNAGFMVTASTGRIEHGSPLLRTLGATDVIDREELSEPGKALQSETWAAVVDCVGSHTLANAVAQTQYGGIVTACGLAQGQDLPASVHPFILRGVRLQGINSVYASRVDRERAWELARQWLATTQKFSFMTRTVQLEDVPRAAEALLHGEVMGRTIVTV